MSIPSLGCTHSPVWRVSGFFPAGKSGGGGLAFTTDLHVVPRLRRVDYTSTPPICLCGVDKENFTVRFAVRERKALSGSDWIVLSDVIWIRGWDACKMTAQASHTYLCYLCKCRSGRSVHIFGKWLLIKSIIIWSVNVVGLEEFNPWWFNNLIVILERYFAFAVRWIRGLAYFAFLLLCYTESHTDLCASLVSSYFKHLYCIYVAVGPDDVCGSEQFGTGALSGMPRILIWR